jgi:hypothetical protein
MKKLFYAVVLLTGLSATATTPPEVNEKVLKAFKETFANAENVSWKEMDNSCQADFKQFEITVHAVYDNDGNLLETTRYYTEKGLPPNILSKLKKKYPGKEVYGVNEISSDQEISYYITLQDDKFWYNIKSDPYASLEQTSKFKKAATE